MKQHEKKSIKEHQIEEEDLAELSFEQVELHRVYAKGLTFRNVSFKQAIIDKCYFRKCTFTECDFTGAEISDTNMQGADFAGCIFNYTTFNRTLVGTAPIAKNLPSWDNVKMHLAKNLRMNYASIGDYDGVNFAIRIELAATKEHLHKAAFSREAYYRNKPEYSGWKRIWQILHYTWFLMLDLLWGNGERPIRMLGSIPALLALATALVIGIFNLPVMDASSEVFSTFIFGGKSEIIGVWTSAAINLLRLLVIGMFVSSIVRRLSRR